MAARTRADAHGSADEPVDQMAEQVLEQVVEQVVEPCINEVRLVGRVSVDPERRELPSGDTLVSLRLVVDRPEGAQRSRQRVDALECAVWAPRVQRTVSGWRAGDRVEVQGALRRRFFRAGGATASRVEIEVARAKIIRRSRTG